jgi:hypothetical protein
VDVAFPGESAEYRAARDRLLEQEIELRRAMEALAAARRRLPPGGIVPQDYIFQGPGPDGGPAEVRLSELMLVPAGLAQLSALATPMSWPTSPMTARRLPRGQSARCSAAQVSERDPQAVPVRLNPRPAPPPQADLEKLRRSARAGTEEHLDPGDLNPDEARQA